ncbi:DUF885 domain-containing protein [Ornithinimicrobium sufpigmenti]|uniref:DUF885 domain-containing protein n=1 Tax=Ornithinimicrobium sufpigmenti TaxID=2508882 RepID=UPI001EE0D033|nr:MULTISPECIES: DUF885 domain-containing protein [unclassified Ornithinimicrobium]
MTATPHAIPNLGRPGRVADSYVHGLALLDPGAAQVTGRESVRPWAALGPRAVADRAALTASTLAEVDRPSEEPTTRAGAVLRLALSERLRSDLALHDSGFTPGLVAPLASPAHAVMMGLESAPSEQRVEGLTRVPVALRDYAEQLEETAARGYVVPARQSRTLAAQVRRWADPEGDDRLGALLSDAGSGPDRPEAATALADARAACRALATWLEEVHAPRGATADAVGRDLYGITSRAFLGTSVDLDETYAYGWDRLRELTAQAQTLAAELGADSLDEAAAQLDADPTGRVAVGPDLVDWVETRMTQAATRLQGSVFDIPAGSRCGAVLAAPGSGSIYYSPPDPAGTRPGRVVWSTPTGAMDVPVWREVSTVHHEGLPGHHLQHVVTMSTESLHPWQRYLCHVHGYAEGWAHYTEGRAADWGLIQHPGEQLGVVLAQRWRAARIVIDMGLHLGYPIPSGNDFTQATRWTREVGVEVLMQAAGCDAETARFEVVRYLGWPGQALAFSMGARLWEQAREVAMRRGTLDERSFHRQALALGPMGMAPLQTTLEDLAHA